MCIFLIGVAKVNNYVRLFPLLLVGILSLASWYKKSQQSPYPFKCTSFTTYHLKDVNGRPFSLSVAQDLRFESKTEGYLLFSGRVKSTEGQWLIQRGVALNKGFKVDSDTFKFHIKRISVAPEDNTPERYFTPLIREFSLDDIRMQLDVINIGEKVYIIGSPFSFLFSCVRY